MSPGQRDGRVSERVRPNYTPTHLKDFDAEKEWHACMIWWSRRKLERKGRKS